ncbi:MULTISPECIES: HNH endonuclease [Cryobacterium]|uniref:HNH endonuclease n=1 Tax=Cryobacterium TaxID=69578 RepID=UPI000CD480C0|nr:MULTISPECIES: HNH endonuclease signature motif containing protein [Cryobacterium]POH65564.1 hypothetical protein C3B60_11765 [Cryobacterium zongtaii]TFC45265.1 HNH endonuclease [Cryobacterium sp. TMN-39-2]
MTHPETCAVLSVGKEHYKAPADLRRWVALRGGTCRFPGCTRPASRSDLDLDLDLDLDHTIAREHGGPTDYDNLAHLCRAHHRLKHQTLWAVVQEPGGVLRWTSPAGETHRTYPETTLGPPPTLAPTPERPAAPARPQANDRPDDPPPF